MINRFESYMHLDHIHEVEHQLNKQGRFYHNVEHILYMFDTFNKRYDIEEQDFTMEELCYAICYHDFIYDVKQIDNEEKSVDAFINTMNEPWYSDNLNANQIKNVCTAILETKDHKPTSELGKMLCELDMAILYDPSLEEFIAYEDKIFKEYQYLDYEVYKQGRLDFLQKHKVRQDNIDYVKNVKRNIGVFCGSFNPFHVGHLNILEQAEQIFDKVIIARGVNPDKVNNKVCELPESIQYREIISYSNLITDMVKSKNYPTLVRGIRNSVDLEAERKMQSFILDLDESVKVVYLFCDPEYQYISSSDVRHLEKFNCMKYSVK